MTNRIKKSSLRLAILGLMLSLVAGAAFADKPDRAERSKFRAAQEYRDQNHKNHRHPNDHKKSTSQVIASKTKTVTRSTNIIAINNVEVNAHPAWQKRTSTANHQGCRRNGTEVNRSPSTYATTSCHADCALAYQHLMRTTVMSGSTTIFYWLIG